VGPNGAGKSTLLKLVGGELQPDSGSVWLDPASSIAYLPQYPLDELELSIRESLWRGAGRVGELRQRMEKIERGMTEAGGERLERLLAEYAEVQEEFERRGGYGLDSRMQQVINGLSLDAFDLEMPVSALSGGNKTKLSLARLLLSGAQVLLLDEPTNYLDLPALLWLERFIGEGYDSYIIVSHDRRFLDRTVTGILEIDPVSHGMREWPGNYSDYAEARLREEQKRLEQYRDQQEEIARIEEDIRRTKEQARGTEARTKSGLGADHARRLAKKVARKAKARERKLERDLEANTIEKPIKGWGLHLVDLGRDPIDDNRIVLEMENVRAGYDGREVLKGASLLVRGRDRVALLGENGSGKSTLVRCITESIPYQGSVRIGASVRLGVLSQESDELPLDRPVLDIFRSRTEMLESDARAYLHKFLFQGDEVFKPVRALSYGQRSKLALAVLILSDANFLVLDEPTSHMDMPALEAIERALEEYTGPLLLVSHDRYFVERVGVNRVDVLEHGMLRAVESVDEYERELVAGAGRHRQREGVTV
jgi:ATPase subunit of ABC transporter with duplicated ATPase domains